MNTHTFESRRGLQLARPVWLPWVLVAVAWVVAVAAGLFESAPTLSDTGRADGSAPALAPVLGLTAGAALAWSEAHSAPVRPKAPALEPKTVSAPDPLEAAVPEVPEDGEAADGPEPVFKREVPTERPAAPPKEAPDRTARRAEDPAPRHSEKPAPAEPKPRREERDSEPKTLAAPTTELPTITVNPPPPKIATNTKETAQEATARATAHLNAKRWTEAEDAFGQALGLPGGRSAAVLYGRARAREARGDDEGAENDLKEALAIDPRHPYALLLLGDLAKSKGNRAAAQDAYRRYVEAWPTGRRTGELTLWLGTDTE